MPEKYIPLPADLIFTHGEGWISSAIRFFQRHRGEEPSYANHTAGIGSTQLCVVEALWRVISTPLEIWLSEHPQFQIWRMTSLDLPTRARIAKQAESYIGAKYGVLKVGLHMGDGVLGKVLGKEVYFFRRMAFMKPYPICSWEWAWAYWSEGIQLGPAPAYQNPDAQLDYAMGNPDWRMVLEAP